MTETWSYGEATEPRTFPWPPPEDGSVIGAFGETWKSATLDPGSFFSRMPRRGGTGAAILYYLVIGILVAGVSLFWDLTGVFTGAAGDEALAAEMGMGSVDPLVAFLLSPLVLMIALVVAAAITHLVLLITGGAAHGFATTLRVFAFAYSPMIFGVIPYLGGLVGTIWMVVVAIVGLREGHETDGWKAALAVLLPLILLMGLAAMVFMVLFAAGAALLAA